jgi:hypothetical protein
VVRCVKRSETQHGGHDSVHTHYITEGQGNVFIGLSLAQPEVPVRGQSSDFSRALSLRLLDQEVRRY